MGTAKLRAAAAQSWIARNPFGFSVLHYDDVVAMLRDKRWHSATSRIMEMSGITDPVYLERRRTSILSAEGDEHTRLRRLVGKAFSPRAADRLRPFMREVVDGLVDAVAPRGRADVAVDICEPYPIPIICELLGAPKEDWKEFSRWADRRAAHLQRQPRRRTCPIIVAAQDELDEYTRGLIADRRDKPADDLHHRPDRRRGGRRQALDRGAGDDGRGGDRRRHRHDPQPARLRASPCSPSTPTSGELLAEQPELAPRAVEETMRYFGAVRGTGRFASEDIVYRDVLFPAGHVHRAVDGDGELRRRRCSATPSGSTSPASRPGSRS